jgi:hypothetical protein
MRVFVDRSTTPVPVTVLPDGSFRSNPITLDDNQSWYRDRHYVAVQGDRHEHDGLQGCGGGEAVSSRRRILRSATAAAAGLAAVAAPLVASPSFAEEDQVRPDASAPTVAFDLRHELGGDVPENFVGLSIEWSLVERYMGENARPPFGNLLANLGTGVLRIGGSSQDVMRFDPDAANTNEVITPDDLVDIRATLDAVNEGGQRKRPAWGVVLGTAMSPVSDRRPFVSPQHARTFVTQGVAPVFSGDAARDGAGIELGNEPDLSYRSHLDSYLQDLRTYSDASVTGPFPVIAPNTSEDILPWESIDGRSVPTRYFWDWPKILDVIGPVAGERAGVFGAYASDHFYPLARTCRNKPYRCPSTEALLSDRHMSSLDYQVFTHAREATEHGLGYRLEETNTAAGRGADGVSNVAASATYALDMMFHAACPQPPQPGAANADCSTRAIGVNLHNAEVRAFFSPEEGNAYYNVVDYDASPAMGAPSAAPEYYALLLFSRFAQGASGLRPVHVAGTDMDLVKGWRVEGPDGARRLFLINKSDHPVRIRVGVPTASALVDRMTPYDPEGAGRTLDAPGVRIDGREVRPDGTWPGFAPTRRAVRGEQMDLEMAPGEAVVVRVRDDETSNTEQDTTTTGAGR